MSYVTSSMMTHAHPHLLSLGSEVLGPPDPSRYMSTSDSDMYVPLPSDTEYEVGGILGVVQHAGVIPLSQ